MREDDALLRSLNRPRRRHRLGRPIGGWILLDGNDIDFIDVTQLRRQVGMVFQQLNPFPMSIFDNIAYGCASAARGSRRAARSRAGCSQRAAPWAGLLEEVKDDLQHPALRLSGGQQQRLCIARSLAVQPGVAVGRACSALDPISTGIIEELIAKLRTEIAIVIVTHNLQQAQRVADRVAFMYLGDHLAEHGAAEQVFLKRRRRCAPALRDGALG